MKSQSKRFPKARPRALDDEDPPLQQKPLSKKEASLKFYEPPAQFRHLLTLGSKVMPTKNERTPAATTATGNVPFVRSSTASTAPADAGSDRTLPEQESASSMSDNDDDENNNRESSSSSSSTDTASTSDDEQVSKNASVEEASSSRKERSMARLLKKSLRHLDDILQSTMSKHHKETKKKSSKKQNNGKNLPETGFFSNNHVMVNRERALVDDLKPLHRSLYLDSLALSHAVDMADACQVQHLVERSSDLRRLLQSNEVGENVQRGKTICDMHTSAMKSENSRMRNILRPAYTEFGMATAVSKADGKLYMVQLFRGPTLQEDKSQQQPEQPQDAEPSSETAPEDPKEEEEESEQIAQL